MNFKGPLPVWGAGLYFCRDVKGEHTPGTEAGKGASPALGRAMSAQGPPGQRRPGLCSSRRVAGPALRRANTAFGKDHGLRRFANIRDPPSRRRHFASGPCARLRGPQALCRARGGGRSGCVVARDAQVFLQDFGDHFRGQVHSAHGGQLAQSHRLAHAGLCCTTLPTAAVRNLWGAR